MSNISSLLKYRYQKRTSVVNSEDSPVVISSSSGCTISDSGSESPQIVLDAKSPIFPSKFARSADHRDTQATPVTKPPFLCETKASCSNGSPWLSKESRIAHSEQPIAKRPVVQLPSHSSSTTASYTKSDVSTFSTKSPVFSRKSPSAVSIDPGELQAKVSQLIGMFPDVDRSLLENALICTNGNVDAAEEQIIYARSPKSCNIGDKRKLVKSPDSSLFESSSKRARQLSYSDESSDIMCSSGSISPVVTNGLQHSSAEPSFFESTVLPYEKILLLQEKFPEISRHELKRVLNASDFNVDLAAETLRSYKTNEPILPTTNSSSIKAIMASRVQSKAVHTLSANTMDGCEEDDSPIKVSKKMDRRIFIVDSDSNDDAESETSKTVSTKSTNELVFDFFNVATVEEMQIMDGCSRKKAEEIAKMRPFEDWNDLVVKVESNPLVPSFILSEGREVIRLRSTVMELMERCRVISTRLESLVSDLTKRTSIDQHDNERNYVTEQPRCLSNGMSLKPYQMVGLNWLILMHNQGLNGILGDEMGLGKTIQTIAFLAYLHGEGTRTPHVIIAPSSTIDNWLRELRLWCPSLRVQLYYGTQESRRAIRAELLDGIIDEFHVLLTSYNIATGTTDDRMLFKRLKFGYAIFDEGHMLKNMSSIRFKSLMKIQAKRRLLLTGTPLQNNLLELMSLLAFLMPDMFIGKTDILKKIFVTFTGRNTGSDTSCGTYERETLAHAKNILKPFFLRRLKTEVLGQLPQKTVKSVKVPLSFEQQELYDELIAKFAPYIDQNLPPQNVNSESTKQSTAGVPGRVKEVERKLKTSNKKSVKKQRRKCDDEFSDSDSLHDGVIDDDTNDCEAVEEGKVGNERQLKQIGQSGSAYIMALRKAANHHLLHRHQYDERKLRMMAELMLEEPTHKNANVDYIYEDMQVMSDFELHKLCSQYPVLNPFRLDSETITDSGKFRHLDELLPPLKASGNRVLLFSQFTMMLDIVEEYMMSRKHKYLRLDGSTPVAERQELIDQFNADKSIFVFLLSTKAGGLGINLTAANVVILHDIDFNPYNDKQAEDRCHRVGQIREVTVYRLISKNTIEEAMLRCAEAKLRLEQNVTGTRTKESDEVDPTDVASLLKEALLMRSNS